MKCYFLLCFVFLALKDAYSQIKVETLIDNINASGGVKLFEGKIYIANFGSSLENGTGAEIYESDKQGNYELFATGFNGASGNVFDQDGNLYQSSISGGFISKVSRDGSSSFLTSQLISCNVGVTIDKQDNLYICNCCGQYQNTITKVSSNGVSSLFSSSPLFNCPNGITIDNEDNLYVSNFGNGNIIKVTPDGNASLLAVTSGIGNAASNGHIVYSNIEDLLYVASHGANSIYKLTKQGELTLLVGTGQRGNTDGDITMATFSRPNGIALNETGDTMYINSSIPTIDTPGSRPLNPSKLRMITGFNTTSSVNDPNSIPSILVYPNPSNGEFFLNFSDLTSSKIRLKLFNLSGDKMWQKEIDKDESNRNHVINVKNLSPASYILTIESEKGYSSQIISIVE